MSLLDRMESGLQRTLNGVFAKAFRSEVQPVELASGVREAMDKKAVVVAAGRMAVPNHFRVELSPGDFERLESIQEGLCQELVAAADEHADTQHYEPAGPIEIEIDSSDRLETGVYRIVSRSVDGERAPASPRSRRGAEPSNPSPYRSRTAPAPRYPSDAADGTAGAGAAVGAAAGVAASAAGAKPTNPVEPAASPAAAPAEAAPRAAAPSTSAPRPPARNQLHDPSSRPWLDVNGERYPLLSAITVVGRDDSADVILDDLGISRRHAELRVTVDGPRLITSVRDLGSTNGTLVNGADIQHTRLADGDEVTVGRISMTFRAGPRG